MKTDSVTVPVTISIADARALWMDQWHTKAHPRQSLTEALRIVLEKQATEVRAIIAETGPGQRYQQEPKALVDANMIACQRTHEDTTGCPRATFTLHLPGRDVRSSDETI